MNPKEFSWKEDQSVTVTNPSDKDYEFKVHNKPYMVKSGQTARMPGYIAWVYVYGLSTQLCQADGNFSRWNEEGYRDEYYNKIVVGADDVVEFVAPEPQVEVETFDEPESPKEVKRGRPAKV